LVLSGAGAVARGTPDAGAVSVGLSESQIDAQRGIEVANGLSKFPAPQANVSASVGRRGQAGVQFQRAIEIEESLVVLTSAHQDTAANVSGNTSSGFSLRIWRSARVRY
jgi:hypothetical protein